MPDGAAGAEVEHDGRRRRGRERRRNLIDAVLAVIGRDGLAAVTQRSVAAQAGVPPSAVYYYFATLDDLVAAALVDVTDRFLTELDGIDPAGDDPLRDLAVVIVGAARPGRGEAMAELELWMLAARDDRLRGEIDRWDAGLRATAARLSDEPTVVDALTAALTGYHWQAATGDRFHVEHLEAILRHIIGRGPPARHDLAGEGLGDGEADDVGRRGDVGDDAAYLVAGQAVGRGAEPEDDLVAVDGVDVDVDRDP